MSVLIQAKANEKKMARKSPQKEKNYPNQRDVMKNLFLSLAESVQQLRGLVDLLPVR